MKIPVKKLYPDAIIPTRATPGSAGWDLYAHACLGRDGQRWTQPFELGAPGARRHIGTGIALALPLGAYGQVCSRSGLALKHGVAVLNAPGIIDSDYRGEVGAILINHGDSTFALHPGDRVAQLVLPHGAELVEVDELPETERGTGGFGSSGR